MPKPLSADWDLAKSLILKGFTQRDAAKQIGVSYDALKKRAYREQWDKERDKVADAVSRVVVKETTEAAKGHVHKVVAILEKHLEALEKRSPRGLTLEECETAAKLLDRLDQIGRRNHGLDAQEAGNQRQSLVQVIVQSGSTSHPAPPMRIVTSHPGATGATPVTLDVADPETPNA